MPKFVLGSDKRVASTPPPRPSVMERIRSRAAHLRLGAVQRPKNSQGEDLDPILPADLTSLNDTQIGVLWTQICAVVVWAKRVHAMNAVEAADLKRRERIVRAKAFLAADGGREERDALREIDPEVVAVGEDLMVAQGVKELSFAMYEGYLTLKEAVSREFTRRIELEQHRGMGGDAPRRGVGFRR